MYKCICNKVSEESIEKIKSLGCYSIEEIYDMLDVGKDCGICIKEKADKATLTKDCS